MLKRTWQDSETPILSKCDQTYSNITSEIPPAKQETYFSTAFSQVVKGWGPSSKLLNVIPLAFLRLHLEKGWNSYKEAVRFKLVLTLLYFISADQNIKKRKKKKKICEMPRRKKILTQKSSQASHTHHRLPSEWFCWTRNCSGCSKTVFSLSQLLDGG